MAREAELQRRATIRKLQLEQSQAVMRNRNWAMQSPMAQEPGWPSRLHAIELRPKARRRDFDDGHSTSSSDVHSISTMSVTSLSTTDSDSGPSLRTPPSIFSSLREASSSSLLEPFDDFSISDASDLPVRYRITRPSMDPSSPSDPDCAPPINALHLLPAGLLLASHRDDESAVQGVATIAILTLRKLIFGKRITARWERRWTSSEPWIERAEIGY